MASTRTLQNVVNWAQSFVGLRPLSGQGGIPGEPALSIANTVLGFILGPPFAWRWNRKRTSFVTTISSGSAYNQAYANALSDFGWLESATVSDGVTTWDLEVRLSLPDALDVGRPTHISAELDDDEGNITFSLYPVPDKVYTVAPVYQKKMILFTSLAGVWSPIPDEYQYIYNSGFLAGVFENVDDARFVPEYQKFIRSVISSSEGLTDTQKELFLTEKMVDTRQQQNSAQGVQQGRQSRGA